MSTKKRLRCSAYTFHQNLHSSRDHLTSLITTTLCVTLFSLIGYQHNPNTDQTIIGFNSSFAKKASPLKIASSSSTLTTNMIKKAFGKQGIRISKAEANSIKKKVKFALNEARTHGIGNSKVDFAAIEIAQVLDLDIGPGSSTVQNISRAIKYIIDHPAPKSKKPPLAWLSYYRKTLSLNSDRSFLKLVRKEKFSPVKISWEDIGRHKNSSWGDRISDVGIWVRQREADPKSAQLALSVRRDNNFRDKVLVVPSDRIKIHRVIKGETQEFTLTQRLKQLKLYSKARDKNVIVSNQFAIVPVPAHDMRGAWKPGVPPRAAFNFSIYPYGSTNYVITDVIEGSSEAIVGPGNHQYLFYNVKGKKAPFTASRAQDRPDLLELEAKLKAKGMDVDVQRYYLIQIPLKRGKKIKLSNMGTPMTRGHFGLGNLDDFVGSGGLGMEGTGTGGGGTGFALGSAKKGKPKKFKSVKNNQSNTSSKSKPMLKPTAPPPSPTSMTQSTSMNDSVAQPESLPTLEAKKLEIAEGAPLKNKPDPTAGLTKVAIGHGEAEGKYNRGSGYRGNRDNAPIRVTVVYFVTPVGQVTKKDMKTFTAAFKKWDSQAIWGGSFVTKESW